ncbi:hypothetical protein DMUE_2460 [Dictyocoela muelleri]|nr:hypothetical protein DMUE_2460 [Dictyocoela muelleri]
MKKRYLLYYLFENNSIHNKMSCVHCSSNMRQTEIEESEMGMNWRRVNNECILFQTTLSLRNDIFFQNISLSIKTNLKIVYYLLLKVKQSNIVDFTGVNRRTIGSIKQKLISYVCFF